MKIIEKFMDKYLLPNKHVQDWVNNRYKRPGYTAIPSVFLDNVTCNYKGFKLVVNDQIESMIQVESDYIMSDILNTDVVLDIGANIGAFTLLASKKAKQVFAVEPLFTDLIYNHLSMNNIKNVDVFNVGLWYEGKSVIEYGQRKQVVRTCSLKNIINMCGKQIDFLKLDCEGGEWSIKPEELEGIRRIEAEVHNLKGLGIISGKGNRNFQDFLMMLEKAGFEYNYEKYQDLSMKVHAMRK